MRSSSSCRGEAWMSSRFSPAASYARIFSATCSGVPTSSGRSARVPTEYSRFDTSTSRFECVVNSSKEAYPGEFGSTVVMRSSSLRASASVSRMMMYALIPIEPKGPPCRRSRRAFTSAAFSRISSIVPPWVTYESAKPAIASRPPSDSPPA